MFEETFASPELQNLRIRGLRVAAVVAVLAVALVIVRLVSRLSPDTKLLLFDAGVGFILAMGLNLAARRMIAAEACGQRRTLAAILIGVAASAGVQGIFVVTLFGSPLGAAQLGALVMIQLLGAVGGVGLGFLTSFVGMAMVAAARAITKTSTPRIDGLFVGAMSGLLGGLCLVGLPHLGSWFVVTSMVICAIAGWRAAILFERALAKGD